MYCSRSQNRTWGGSWSLCWPFRAGAEPTLLRFWAEPSPCRKQRSLAGLMCQPSCLWAQKLGLNLFVEFLGSSGCLEKVLDGAKPLSSVQERTGAAVQEVSQPSLELLKCVRLRWRHLLLKTNEDVSQQRPTKHCCDEENLSRNTLLSLPELKM